MKNNNWRVVDDGTQKTSEIVEELKKLFTVNSYYNNEQLDKDFPTPEKPTIRYFKANIEADEENKNKCADEINDVDGITVRERLILEFNYYQFTGKHLDIENWTLCAGSRSSGGDVPSVHWNDNKLHVSWSYTGDARGYLRARIAISNLIEEEEEMITVQMSKKSLDELNKQGIKIIN